MRQDRTRTLWIEVLDDGSASAGLIQITGGELRLRANTDIANDPNLPSIERAADLSSSTTARLSFNWRVIETGEPFDADDQV